MRRGRRRGSQGSDFIAEGKDLSSELLVIGAELLKVGAELLKVGLLLLVKLKEELLVGHDNEKNRDLT